MERPEPRQRTVKSPTGEREPDQAYTTRAQAEFKRRNVRRLAWAGVAAVVILLILAWLGPDAQVVRRKFEHYGKPGELRIMPEVSIDEGSDRSHQLPKSLRKPPPPAVILPEERNDPRAEEKVPVPNDSEAKPALEVARPDDLTADTAQKDQVELKLPSQSNPDWYLLKQVNPEYPLDSSEADRRTPVVFVKVGIFVGPDGLVRETIILATNGSPVFGKAVLEAVKQWKFGWRVDPREGRWIEMTWNFRSPYIDLSGSRP